MTDFSLVLAKDHSDGTFEEFFVLSFCVLLSPLDPTFICHLNTFVAERPHLAAFNSFRCSQIGEEWDDSIQSKERIEANLLSKHEAAMRRERALAYAFSHQVIYSSYNRFGNETF